jgi:hypothetical protein
MMRLVSNTLTKISGSVDSAYDFVTCSRFAAPASISKIYNGYVNAEADLSETDSLHNRRVQLTSMAASLPHKTSSNHVTVATTNQGRLERCAVPNC